MIAYNSILFVVTISKITNPESASQFILVKDSSSNRVNDLLIHNTIPITFYDNLLIFRDTIKVQFRRRSIKNEN